MVLIKAAEIYKYQKQNINQQSTAKIDHVFTCAHYCAQL